MLLEVMDKEASVSGMWISGLALGALGYFLARRWRWTSFLFVALGALLLWGTYDEITDPFVGPAILKEAGPLYKWHAIASALAVVCLPLAGAILRGKKSQEVA